MSALTGTCNIYARILWQVRSVVLFVGFRVITHQMGNIYPHTYMCIFLSVRLVAAPSHLRFLATKPPRLPIFARFDIALIVWTKIVRTRGHTCVRVAGLVTRTNAPRRRHAAQTRCGSLIIPGWSISVHTHAHRQTDTSKSTHRARCNTTTHTATPTSTM